jgi:hypothetical protein
MSTKLKGKYGTIEGHKLNLAQCLSIQENNYTSKDGHTDYDPQSIEDRINALHASMASKRSNYLRKMLDSNMKQYNEFLESQGVPEFYFTWNEETESYIEF